MAAQPCAVTPTRGHRSAQMDGGHSSSTGGPFTIPTVATVSSSEKGEGPFQGQARPWLPSYTAQARDFGMSAQTQTHHTSHFPRTGRGWITRLCSLAFRSFPWGEQGQGSWWAVNPFGSHGLLKSRDTRGCVGHQAALPGRFQPTASAV